MKNTPTYETLFARWVEGTITPEEAQYMAELEGVQELQDALDIYSNLSLPPMDLDAAWDKLAPKTVHQPKTIKTKHRSLLPTMMRFAAAIAVIVGVGFWYSMYVVPKHFSAGIGQTASVILPDGSSVTLNAQSTLSYSKWNWSRKRIINLSGEAFFKVAKGEKFTVLSPHGATSVLGTQFDVQDRGNTLQVKCFEGKVEVISQQVRNVITKGQGVKVNQQIVKKLDVNTAKPAWIAGQTRFLENSLLDVFDEMQRQYILEIDIEGVDLKRTFTGVVPNDNLDKALAIVTGAMNLTYQKINDNKVKISAIK